VPAARSNEQGLVDRFGSLDSSDGGTTSRYSLSVEAAKRWADGQTRFGAYLVRSRLNLFSNFTFFLDDPENGDQFEQAERRTMAGFDLGHTWFGKMAGLDTSNRMGVQTRYDKLDPVAPPALESLDRKEKAGARAGRGPS